MHPPDAKPTLVWKSLAPEWQVFIQTAKGGVQISTPREINKMGRLLSGLVGGEFLGNGFLDLFRIHGSVWRRPSNRRRGL